MDVPPETPESRRAYIRFRNAFADFADDPSPANLARYLAASRALTDARGEGAAAARARRARPAA